MAEATETRARRSPGRRDEILDVAEKLARKGGYSGFSFRDVAAEVGVKSASIHYHFPTKTDLTVAMTDRYRHGFLANLGPVGEPGAILRLISAYREAVQDDDGMCLCGLFAAEFDALPEPLQDSVSEFFHALVIWTEAALADEPEAGKPARPDGVGSPLRTGAEALVSGLEGAFIAARAMRDTGLFDRVAARLLDSARGQPWRSTSA